MSVTGPGSDCTTTAPARKGERPWSYAKSGTSAALDPRGVLQHAATAVLRLRDQRRTALLHGQVPGTRGEFGDRRRRTVLREQRTRHRHGEPERREVRGGGRGLRLRLLRLGGVGLTRLRLAAVRGLLGTGVAVTAGGLGAVGLRGGGLGGGDEGTLEGGDQGVATAAAAISRVAMRARIRPMPALTPLSEAEPTLSVPPSGSKMFPSAVQAAKTVKATPN